MIKPIITRRVETRYQVPYIGGPNDKKFWDGLHYHFMKPPKNTQAYKLIKSTQPNSFNIYPDEILTSHYGDYKLLKSPSLHYKWQGYK